MESERLIEIPFDVAPHEHGMRLDMFLSRRMKRMSRTLAAKLVRQGRVRRTPIGVIKASARVYAGDQIIIQRKPLKEAPWEDVVIPIIYEDHRMLGVNKPGSLVVHPTASHYHRTLIRILRSRRQNEALDLAHRIDKETSGLVLVAKDFTTSSHLKKQFAARKVAKSYLAIVRGDPSEDAFPIDAPLRLAESVSNVVMEVTRSDDPKAQPALTEVVVLARAPGIALVEVRPRTGRQHQIRVHLHHVGLPIVGDKLYLGGESFFMDAIVPDFPREIIVDTVGHERQALHAWKAVFCHPESGAKMELSAPLPVDMMELSERLGLSLAHLPDVSGRM
ncbi:MAG: RluA family pseudouridine synthase [Myxococcales bacterium]|nr:RluA family pseudouridine synthase [Myxococcales bacterium]